MSTAPITDSLANAGKINQDAIGIVATMERDLAAAQEENKTLKHDLSVAQNWADYHGKHADELISELAALREKLEKWEAVSEMGPAWVSASLVEMAHLRSDLAAAQKEVERFKHALHSSCGEEREMSVSEGLPHVTCGLADELTARAEKAEAELAAQREDKRRLMEALDKISMLPWPNSESPYARIARAAISAAR